MPYKNVKPEQPAHLLSGTGTGQGRGQGHLKGTERLFLSCCRLSSARNLRIVSGTRAGEFADSTRAVSTGDYGEYSSRKVSIRLVPARAEAAAKSPRQPDRLQLQPGEQGTFCPTC